MTCARPGDGSAADPADPPFPLVSASFLPIIDGKSSYYGPGFADLDSYLTDALAEWSQTAFVTAPLSCTHDHVDGESCAWYHGPWSALRVLDVVSSPTWHKDFYIRALEEIRTNPVRRVLISGAADFSMLAFIYAAWKGLPAPRVDVVDLCRTPLDACQWYARRSGATVAVHQQDILAGFTADVPSDGGCKFELIVADALLTRFDSREAGDVLANWYSTLRPGGAVITTVRLHPRDRFIRSEQSVDLFVGRVTELARRHHETLKIGVAELTEAARQYAWNMTSFDHGDVDHVTKMFTAAGFDVVGCEKALVAGEIVPTEYARICARRPSA